MSFSNEWEQIYQKGAQNSVWPWNEVISLTARYFNGEEKNIRVLELGCGAGANIPYFKSREDEYCGIEGSETKVRQLNNIYKDSITMIKCADFTKEIPFERGFDLVLDRSSITHNNTEDIAKTLKMSYNVLSKGGYLFGLDWFSKKMLKSLGDNGYRVIDDNTFVFTNGYFNGLGNVHFSDGEHIEELLKQAGFQIVELYEKTHSWRFPQLNTMAWWSFVARKE